MDRAQPKRAETKRAEPRAEPGQGKPRLSRQLEELKDLVLRMGRLSEAILAKSVRALWEHDVTSAGEVERDDLAIDRLDVSIDRAVLEVLALQSPVARDLRQVIGMKTAATDLERVGDLARNIAKCTIRLSERERVPFPQPLRTLADHSQRMLSSSLAALADESADIARDVLAADDRIDQEEDLVIRQTIAEIQRHPEITGQAVDLILVAKHLERIGDHATNIAEDVILVAESVNVKHAEKLTS